MGKKKSFILIVKCFIYQLNKAFFSKKPILPIIGDLFAYIDMNRNLDKSSLGLELPWISLGAYRYLLRLIRCDMTVFEYGSGGSTLFFSKFVNKVISVEHNLEWFNYLSSSIYLNGKSNIELNLIVPETKINEEDIVYGSSRFGQFEGMDFYNYVNFINIFEDNFFDLILIDGRVRVACFKTCISKLKPGGYLILDNSEREEYYSVVNQYSDWLLYRYYGPVVQDVLFSETSIFQKPNI